MSLSRLEVMYGHIDGAQGKFARDPSGYLAIEAGIFRKHGLDVSWQHVQGTEERYSKLEDGSAHISLVVGRAALQHYLDSKATRILGSSMNTSPYLLLASTALKEFRDLEGKSLACMEGAARIASLERVFQDHGLRKDSVALRLTNGDQDAFNMLIGGEVDAALLPRPYGFMAEENDFKRMVSWPEVVDDPLPVMIETTEGLLRARTADLAAFLDAHREGIRYLKTNRAAAVNMLITRFGHSPALAAKTYDDYLLLLDDRMTIDFRHLEKLLTQVAPGFSGGARRLASEWLIPEALRG
jgi:NitT/TauT family transport system substrate-binding protein